MTRTASQKKRQQHRQRQKKAGRCTKQRFRDELGAKMALARIGRKVEGGNTRRKERSIYRCPACRGWHMTSQ